MTNPFSVHPPEELTPRIIADNFVEIYTDFPKLQEPVNLFIHGPRGAGKSIMLRSLEHRVQKLLQKNSDDHLPFFAVHIPIKRSFFGNPEYQRLKGWKATTVGEHLLCVHVVQYLCDALFENDIKLANDVKQEILDLWEDCGGSYDMPEGASGWNDYRDISRFFEREAGRVRQYYVRLPEQGEPDIYSGGLTGFNDFILLIVRRILDGNEISSDPVCFMVDDADNLPEDMQRVLNSWVSSRVASVVCFKVTTQLGYKTYRTIDGRIIESPHDFSEIDIGSVYTSNKGNFAKKINAIVAKRLQNAGIDSSPDDFFPLDKAQARRKNEIWSEILDGKSELYVNLSGDGPSRIDDLAQRYTIPALMRERAKSKSAHTFSYAGLQSLIDLSSGVVRWFLEPATQMYHAVESETQERPKYLPVKTQDSEISKWSKEFREKLNADPGSTGQQSTDGSLHSVGHSKESYGKLGNILDAIGWYCREQLLDNTASEQRFFSFTLHDDPNEELQHVLNLGVRMGYLQKSDLASKSHFGGRRPRYILSRRLGPYYRLDVSGYAAHLSVTSHDLTIALDNPKAFVMARLGNRKIDDKQTSIDFGDGQ